MPNEKTIKVSNATNVVNYWERNKDTSNIYLQFIDFDKVEISIGDDYEGDIDEAIERVQNVIYNAKL